MAELTEDKLKEILLKLHNRINALEKKVAELSPDEEDNNYGEPTQGHPYFGDGTVHEPFHP